MTDDTLRYQRALGSARRPLAYVDLDRFDRNAANLVRRANGLPIRLASKSVRCLALIRRALALPGFSGVLAYRAYEAIHLAKNGVDDIVVAYPTVDPTEIGAAIEEIKLGQRITLMTDRPEHVMILGEIAERQNVDLPIAIDLDLSSRWPALYFGVRRSWVSSESRLADFLKELKKYPRLRLEGAMGYEAQIAGVADRNAFFRGLKAMSFRDVKKIRSERIAQIRAAGFKLRFVNGGGTGSFEETRTDPSVTELAAGSGLFSPTLFDQYASFRHEPAAGFALEVVRKPEENIATCFSGGYVASGSTGNEKLPQPYLPAGLSLFPHEGAGEVQTPIRGEAAERLKIGDSIFFRHAKAGELCERFNELHLISGDKVVSREPTYRGEGKNFG